MPNKRDDIFEPLKQFLREAGEIGRFTGLMVVHLFKPPFEFKELVRQSYYIGYKTLPLVGITAFIMGLVLTLQSRPVLVAFGAENLLPGMVAVSIIREIGPVITALLCAGKISSGIGAELGSMRVTEQIDAMEVSGTNPMNYVVATRVMASTLMIPLLTVYSDAISLIGSYVAVNMRDNLSLTLFFHQAFAPVSFQDLIPSVIKSFFFGFFIGLIGCYKGYNSGRGTESVGYAANTAVVTASLLIFIIDLIAVEITDLFYAF